MFRLLCVPAVALLTACSTHKTISDSTQTGRIPMQEQYWRLVIEENKDFKGTIQDTLQNKAVSLQQKYPNPFCPTTTISFEIFRQGTVDLIIYDAEGREVGAAHKEAARPGKYEAKTKDIHVSSGIYFYAIWHNGIEIDRKKMIILR